MTMYTSQVHGQLVQAQLILSILFVHMEISFQQGQEVMSIDGMQENLHKIGGIGSM